MQDISVEKIADSTLALTNASGCRAYLVLGTSGAALVDTMDGVGDLLGCVGELVGERPLTVLLTHRHTDHVSGAYLYDEVMMSAADDGFWDEVERASEAYLGDAVSRGLVAEGDPWPVRDGRRPRVTHVADGDVCDLGGVHLRCVALPGHTVGSVGWLVEEDRVLLSGDAVTPIMCLCFPESLPVAEWQKTLARMGELDFDRFYTGHHAHAFTKDDLAGFAAAGDFALVDRGYGWHHGFVEGWAGVLHLCPCDTDDVDSPDFRAVITPPRPPRPSRRKA